MFTQFNFSHSLIANLDNSLSATAQVIADLEAQLTALRETQKALEAERQGLLALTQAGESALLQAAKFLGAAQTAGRADMAEAFWQGVDKLRAGTTTPDFPTLAPTPDDPTPDSDNTTIDVEVVPEGDQPADLEHPETITTTAIEGDQQVDSEHSTHHNEAPTTGEEVATKHTENAVNGNGHIPDYSTLSWGDLRKAAKSAGVKVHNKNREQLEAELKNLNL